MARIEKLLVANRGEIAARIMRTAKRMGIATVAVFSDADADAVHVRSADEAVRIGPPPSRDSYLRAEALIDACKRTGATALHPGYGFLSERAELAEACANAGVIFVGPSPSAIRSMGSKRESKETARKAGVPVVPGYNGAEQSVDALAKEGERTGFPLLVKASAGGGGKGMVIVRSASELRDAIASARRVAESAFADGTLILERYIERPRHVEVQILGDAHGNVVHVFERECSIQRRHQKIIEESPSPAVDEKLRASMGASAVALAKAIGYSSAGTVEMILAPDGSYYFLEVNTRLQVEHPVTELVTGLDIVEEQLHIAQGEPLRFTQADLAQRGAAIECRLYAEDPATGFLPSTGTIHDFVVPNTTARLDAGVTTGSEVSIHYDPLLAKVITHGATREDAIARMRRTLRDASILGVRTNRELLLRVLDHPEFLAGKTHTHFLDDVFGGVLEAPRDPAADILAAVAVLTADVATRRDARTILRDIPPGFRNNRGERTTTEYLIGETKVTIAYAITAMDRIQAKIGETEYTIRTVHAAQPALAFEVDHVVRHARFARTSPTEWEVTVAGRTIVVGESPRFPDRRKESVAGGCVAPMPGKITKVAIKNGDRVAKNDVVVVMEAMKMEHSVRAPSDGVVELRVSEGQQVPAGTILAVIG